MPISLEQQLSRFRTIVAATSYSFPIEDSTGYPHPLPPARKIGIGRRSLTGLMAKGKVKGPGPFESALERDFFILLEFDREVSSWHPQPVTISVGSVPGRRATKFTPDVAVEYHKDRIYPGRPICLFEVKYRDELRRDWAELKPRLKAGFRYAKSKGWRFKIVTEIEIRTPRLANAKFFLPYGRFMAPGEDASRVLAVLEREGISTPERLVALCSSDNVEKARYLTTVWILVAAGIIEVDFDQEVNMASSIRASASRR